MYTSYIMKVFINEKRIKSILIENNLSQKDLSRMINKTKNYVSMLITGKRAPSAETRKDIMRVLKVTNFDDIFVITE